MVGKIVAMMMKIGVVLVDDHELLRTGLRARLRREEGVEVLADVGSAAEAYVAIERDRPQVVIMDLDLPGEDGLAATARIKDRWPSVRVVALTGSKPSLVARSVLQAGADGLVTKNEGSDELVRSLAVVFNGQTYLSPASATALAAQIKSAGDLPLKEQGDGLTERERSVLKLLSQGRSYKEIASDLGVSVKTIETYRARMVKKLGCSTRAELVRCAVKLGLVSD